MRPTKVVVIGAGSASFGPGIIGDILLSKDLAGSTLALVDRNEEGLALIAKLARRMNKEWGSGLKIEAHSDRKKALRGAEFVIISIAVEREIRWKLDWEIPNKYGVRQPLGENGGPGAFAHGARNIPMIIDIARDMEKLCPDAWIFNFTNPVPRNTLAVNRYTDIKAVGFCHQIGSAYSQVSRVLDIPRPDLDIKAAGLNHFTWILDIRRKSTGEDLYPAFNAALETYDRKFHPLSREMWRAFGIYPATGDGHMAEYLQWTHDLKTKPWKKYDLGLYNWDGAMAGRDAMWERIAAHAKGEGVLSEHYRGTGERAIPVLTAMVKNANQFEDAVNLPNEGYIENLPEESIVEVPGIATGFGVRGLGVGCLPEPVAELCRRQLTVAELAVHAAVTGDKQAAFQSILLDPMVGDIDAAKGILREFLEVHGDQMPQFAK